jgi:flagellar biosynthesis protein FlhF
MQVKRFRESTVRDALAAVKRDLGPDALVVSTTMVPMRGWRRLSGRREVEVTAAIPATVSESRPAAIPFPVAPDPETTDDDLIARLLATGLDRAMAAEVAAAVPHRARRGASPRVLREALASRLTLIAGAAGDASPIEVFVGPPGVGKTTTIAKIAAQARTRRAGRRTLIAADGYRVGAVEQLRLYADILGAPFAVARTVRDLDRAVTTCRTPALVDTAGRSPSDRGIRDLFDALAGRPGVRTHLVLPATITPREAVRVIERYEAAQPDRVVLTKVDEAETIAPVLRVLRDRRLEVSYLGTGQRVPEDLQAATAAGLAAAVFGDAAPVSEDKA